MSLLPDCRKRQTNVSDKADHKRGGSRLGAQLLGAELMASRELAEGAGTFWDTLERSSRIHQQQLSWLIKDYAGFVDDLVAEQSAWSIPAVTGRLVEKRLSHVSEGWKATSQLLQDELLPLYSAWENFAKATLQDRHL